MTLADQIRDLETRAAAADAATATLAKVRALLLPTAAPDEPDDLQAVAESIDGALQELVDAGRVEAGTIDGRCLADRADDLRAYVQDLLQDLDCARAARPKDCHHLEQAKPADLERLDAMIADDHALTWDFSAKDLAMLKRLRVLVGPCDPSVAGENTGAVESTDGGSHHDEGAVNETAAGEAATQVRPGATPGAPPSPAYQACLCDHPRATHRVDIDEEGDAVHAACSQCTCELYEEKPAPAPTSPGRPGEGFVITRVNSRPTPHRVFFHQETKTWTPYAENATGFSTREEALAAKPNRSKVLHTTELAAAPAAEDAA